jgi:NAD(P)-dependent dehydrogenase (short-subunit alcohol dehydrogenase family)
MLGPPSLTGATVSLPVRRRAVAARILAAGRADRRVVRASGGATMDDFEGKLAVVTGGGSGMGQELVVQLAAAGASVATCDLHEDTLAETADLAAAAATGGAKVTTHSCDVSDESQVDRFRDEVTAQHGRDHINLLFNNAGIGGGGSFVDGDREEWDRTFGVVWGGVYHCSRAFMPLLVASDEGCIINTSSVNGFWAWLGPGRPHTAYSAGKFAVKGFTEALQEDLRLNAPHVKAVLVMPGHIGTNIVLNSFRAHGGVAQGPRARAQLEAAGITDPEQAEAMMKTFAQGFRDMAPVSAAQAAIIILDAVREGRWRLLVGDDAVRIDEAVRANPEGIYTADGYGEAGINLG